MNIPSSNLELDLETLFPFKLDDFQIQAIAALNENKSVVVCAPTGSGKTIIGEYAIHHALAQGKRVFYTTPLKALSNQKLRDFREKFGEPIVGLVTGDTIINVDAPIVVMTTEVFRNMLYDTPIGQVGTSVEDVESVILDECHYLNDRQRGTVWEESIIYCPAQIQIVALSATVGNPEQLTNWIHQVHGPTELVNSDFRPVPLRFFFSNPKGLFPLLDQKRQKINPRLKGKPNHKGKRRRKLSECPQIFQVVNQLQERDLLPAIYLIFSRRGCDQAVEELGEMNLVNPAEAEKLQQLIDEFGMAHPEAVRVNQLEPLHRGIAVHHAGVLPAWKELVETLFEMGLIKVVFATATLAAGVNMPARTTVFSSLSKRSDDGHRLLYASEFLQIAGRAGRRGMDEVGFVVTLQTRFEGAKEAAYLATAKPEPLRSWFTPSYGMVLNLLQTHTLSEVEELLERSFAEYLAKLKLAPEQQAIAKKNAELAKLDVELAGVNLAQLASYSKLRERLKEERRLLKTLSSQAESVRTEGIIQHIKSLKSPTAVYLKGKHIKVSTPVPALIVAQVTHTHKMTLICLGAKNRWYVVTPDDVLAVGESLTHLNQARLNILIPPPQLVIQPGKSCVGEDTTAEIAQQIPSDWEYSLSEAPEVGAQESRMRLVKEDIDNHPLNQFGNPGSIVKRHHRRLALREEVHQHQLKYRQHQSNQSYYWQDFLSLIEVLQEFEALDGYTPTFLGRMAAAIRGDNELWLALAMGSGIFESLEPHHLAGAVCALITEPPRPDSWTDFLPSTEVTDALSQLKETRRKLFQVQRRHHVVLPVWLEREMIGLVEHWALGEESGVDWSQLCEYTSLDEGDLVRMLRRTIDVLWQLPQIPGVSPVLQRNARQAISQMKRFPV